MDENKSTPLDVNTAGHSELVTIPGVGPAIARKIIAARPFSSLAELEQVKGLTPDLVARIAPHFKEVVTPAEAQAEQLFPAGGNGGKAAAVDQPEPEKPAAAEAAQGETLKSRIEDIQEFLSAQPEKLEALLAGQPARLEKVKASTGMSNANLLTLLAACLATMVLTILLTLALFGMINGGLRYPAQNDFSVLSRQVEASAARLDMLEKDTDGIRSRLDALETLSGRMKLIEEENAALRKQLEENSRQVNEVRALMAQTQTRLDELQKSTNFFTRIIDGLRALLNETAQP